MDNYETKMLRQEVESLKVKVAELTAAQDHDRAEILKFIGEVRDDAFQYIADIHDVLWPLVHKTFPEYAKNKKQIDAILKKPGRGLGKEKT